MSERGLGLQAILRNGVSGVYPFSYAETADGLLILANGIDPMLRWDGLAQSADFAGILPPATAPTLGGTGLGTITGFLVAFVRYIDDRGNVSDLSPVSNGVMFGSDAFIQDISYSPTTGVVKVTSLSHGLATGGQVIIQGASGIEAVNGGWTITVTGSDTFTLDGLVNTQGFYTGGAYWVSGALTVVYGGIPVPAQGKVVRRQILRNLSGVAEALYVDIDTDDLRSTTLMSQSTDEQISTGEAIPLTTGQYDLPFANCNGSPPSHKSVLCSHKGRIFASSDAAYSDGHVEINFGSKTAQGVGTNWPSTFVGRLVYADGAANFYTIVHIDVANQIATLSEKFLETPKPFYSYTIAPDPGERRLVYYTEAALPESWPAYNAFAVPEDNDSIVGLLSLGQYLYVIERRHIWRVTFQTDPSDGFTFLASQRGALSNRTYVSLENKVYFLDEIGIHRFDGQDSEAISLPVQNLFQYDGTGDLQIDWAADQTLWHAAHDPVRDTIRWFLNMVGFPEVFHALCYNYRTDRWWIELYPTPILSSTGATIGSRRSLVGTNGRRVLCLSTGNYDGIDGTGTTRGTSTSSTETTLTDTAASFEALEGAPVAIVDGTGVGQERIIASVVEGKTLEVTRPWTIQPDATSVYQVGGIPWLWRSGWFRYIDDETDSPRDIDVVFDPTDIANLMDIQLFFDKNDAARVWQRDITQDGVRTQTGSSRITVDMEHAIGWARQRLTGHANAYSFGDRFVSVQLSGVQSGDFVRVAQVIVAGVE